MKHFKKWLCGACYYFTGISLFIILLFMALFNEEQAISGSAFLLVFPASLVMSAGGLLLGVKAIPRWARNLLHYLFTLLAVFLFLWLPHNPIASPSTVLILLAVFTLVYWLLFLLVHLIGGRIRRLMEED